jgi:hypothetical protein
MSNFLSSTLILFSDLCPPVSDNPLHPLYLG